MHILASFVCCLLMMKAVNNKSSRGDLGKTGPPDGTVGFRPSEQLEPQTQSWVPHETQAGASFWAGVEETQGHFSSCKLSWPCARAGTLCLHLLCPTHHSSGRPAAVPRERAAEAGLCHQVYYSCIVCGVYAIATVLNTSSFWGLIGHNITRVIAKLVMGGKGKNSLTFFTEKLSYNLFNYEMINLKCGWIRKVD